MGGDQTDEQKTTDGWPLVVENDDGIRPAGNPDECLYCRQKIGQPHGSECVCVTKRVKLRYTIEIETDLPHSWDKDMIEFHRNESSWCTDNLIDELQEYVDEGQCLCLSSECEFVRVVDSTPKRRINDNRRQTDERRVLSESDEQWYLNQLYDGSQSEEYWHVVSQHCAALRERLAGLVGALEKSVLAVAAYQKHIMTDVENTSGEAGALRSKLWEALASGLYALDATQDTEDNEPRDSDQ